ncbi:MAG: hypothetical protein MJ224_06020 [archaeon]|nr:hypothetical protein [archaeon]
MIQKLFTMIKRRSLNGSIFILPVVLMLMGANPMQPTINEPPYIIGPTPDGTITQEMIDVVVDGFTPFITDEHWMIVIDEINTYYNTAYFYLYNNPETYDLSRSDFLAGRSYRFDATYSSGREIGYIKLDLSQSNFGYGSGYAKTFTIDSLNTYNTGYVIASSDNFILSGSNPTWIIFQKNIEEPEPDYQGHPKPPVFDGDYPDEIQDSSNILTKIFNRLGKIGNDIREFNNNIFDNFKDFFKPYLDNITQWIKDIRDYIFEEPDMTTCAQLVKESGIGQLLSGAKICYDLFINAVREADEFNSVPRFSWTFILLEHEFTIAYDFGWYNSDVKRLFLSVFIPFWLLGCLIYLCKIIPDMLSGVSGFKGGD